MKRFQAIHWHRSMGIMLVLVFLMIGGSFIAARQVDKMEEGKSFQSLQEETQNLADNIEETPEFQTFGLTFPYQSFFNRKFYHSSGKD